MSYTKARETAVRNSRSSIADGVNRVDSSITIRARQIAGAADALVQSAAALSEISGSTAEARELFFEFISPFQEITSAAILDENGLVFSTDAEASFTKEEAAVLLERAARYPGRPLWIDGDGLYVIRSISENDASEVLVLSLDARVLGQQLLSKQKTLSQQITAIFAEDRHILYQDNAIPENVQDLIWQRYATGAHSFTADMDGSGIYCVTQYNGLTGWVTVSYIDEQGLFPDADYLRQYIVVVVLACILAAGVILMIMARAISRPLGSLNKAMKEVQAQHLDVHLPVDRKDEIGELTESFNIMMARIQDLIDRVYAGKLAQKNAELEALQAQINPHFLYNTLDSINWMLIERDEMEISDVVVSLGKLMQYSMDTSRTQVPLSEEYRNALDYFTIQKNRLEDRLEYQLELEPALEGYLIPKLTLQPLIENAISHGIIPSGRHGRIVVRTAMEPDGIVIAVEDNGDGMNEAELAHFRSLLSGDKEGAANIGIYNVARRLRLHFNDRCRFEVESQPGMGTTVALHLPIIGDMIEGNGPADRLQSVDATGLIDAAAGEKLPKCNEVYGLDGFPGDMNGEDEGLSDYDEGLDGSMPTEYDGTHDFDESVVGEVSGAYDEVNASYDEALGLGDDLMRHDDGDDPLDAPL
ncbi:MAG: sensor histidine kinase [Lachnospiraceae bacterium]|nr:sensor histidine kinase [Lachnospiraceae bacterium]